MIANKEWKYFYSAADDMEFLFNRKTDLRETRNLAGNIFSKDARDRMKKNLLQFLKDNSMDGAYEESGEGLEWKKYPLMDNREYRTIRLMNSNLKVTQIKIFRFREMRASLAGLLF
jgi:hypothetical protein